MAIPKGWKKTIEHIRDKDASLSDKLAMLRLCQEELGASDRVTHKALIEIIADYRTCDECGEMLPNNTAYFGCKRSKETEGICRKCMGESSPQWDEDEREAFHEEMRHQYAEEGHSNEPWQELDDEEIEFLLKHGVPYSEVFVAIGMMPKEYRPLMSKMGYFLACGVTQCKNGHGLRNKHGHCVQCRPAVLEFERRYRQDQFVYIANAASKGLVKVGIAKDLTKRIVHLSAYARATDWVLVTAKKCSNAARVEYNTHKALSAHKILVNYWQGSKPHASNEVFKCNADVAKQAMDRVLGGSGGATTGASRFLIDVYRWRNGTILGGDLNTAELEKIICHVADTLMPIEQEVIRKYYGIGGDEQEDIDKIAVELEITAERCMRTLEKAQRKLRHPSRSRHLEAFLGTTFSWPTTDQP